MTKFAITESERSILLKIAGTYEGKRKEVLTRFAAGIPTMPAQQATQQVPSIQTKPTNPAVMEQVQQFKDSYFQYLRNAGLDKDPELIDFGRQWSEQLRPALEQRLPEGEDIWSKLDATQRLPLSERNPSVYNEFHQPPAAEEIPGTAGGSGAFPSSLEEKENREMGALSDYEMPGFPKNKPQVVPHNMKISPHGNNPKNPIFRGTQARKENMENYDNFIKALAELADMADEAGMLEKADKVAAAIPTVKMLKVAQYEGFMNYWIANGRAFERAYKIKRIEGKEADADPSKFRSPNEVWWEILNEYNESLLGNQSEFNSKYAGKEPDMADRAAAELLIREIMNRIANGATPGVAVYETVEDMGGGGHLESASKQVVAVLEDVKTAAAEKGIEKMADKADQLLKEAQLWQNIKDIGGQFKNWLGVGLTQPQQLFNQMRKAAPEMYRALANYTEKGGQPQPLALWQLEQVTKPLLNPLQQYLDIRKKAGFANNPKLKNLKMYADKNGMVSPEGVQRFIDDLMPITSHLAAEGATEPAQLQKYVEQQKAAQPAAAPAPAAPAATTAPSEKWTNIPRRTPGPTGNLPLPGEAPAAQPAAAPAAAAAPNEAVLNDKINAIVNILPTQQQQAVRDQLLQLVEMAKTPVVPPMASDAGRQMPTQQPVATT